MTTWYAQNSTNWTADPGPGSIWNDAQDGSGTFGTPAAIDTADLNGHAVTGNVTDFPTGFANALIVQDTAGGGSLTLGGGTTLAYSSSVRFLASCNLTLNTISSTAGHLIQLGVTMQIDTPVGLPQTNGAGGQTIEIATGGVLVLNAVPSSQQSNGVWNHGIAIVPAAIAGSVSSTTFGENSAIVLPATTQVQNTIGFGILGGGGPALTGTLTVPANSDIRSGVGGGTCHVPTANQTLNGVAVDATTGNVVLPTAGQVQSGVSFGPSSGTTGTYTGSGGGVRFAGMGGGFRG